MFQPLPEGLYEEARAELMARLREAHPKGVCSQCGTKVEPKFSYWVQDNGSVMVKARSRCAAANHDVGAFIEDVRSYKVVETSS